jgi:hypothetical protein
MIPFVAVDLQALADHLAAPFATLGVIAGGSAIIGAIIGNAEAVERGLNDEAGDAHIQSRYNDGLIVGGTVAVIPVVVLFIEALT